MESSSSNNDNPVFQTHFKTQKDRELIKLALHKSTFFSCLDDEQIEKFVASAELKTYKKGDIIILEGCVDEYNNDDENDENDIDVSKDNDKNSNVVADVKAVKEKEGSFVDDDVDSDSDDEYMESDGEIDDISAQIDEDSNDSQDSIVDSMTIDDRDQSRKKDSDPASSLSTSFDSTVTTTASSTDSTADNKSNDETDNKRNNEQTILPTKNNADDVLVHVSNYGDDGNGSAVCEGAAIIDSDGESISTALLHPPTPAHSGIPRSIYIIRNGDADVWYQSHLHPTASLGSGTLFGEGGFLFGRQHSASIIAKDDNLECFVVNLKTFKKHILPSTNVTAIFHKYATSKDENGQVYITYDDFFNALLAQQGMIELSAQNSLFSLRLANIYNILNPNSALTTNKNRIRIYLEDFCFFHLLISRPDPEIDVAFILMDEKQTGQISLDDLSKFLRPVFPNLDIRTEFFQRYFGIRYKQCIRQQNFSQFLIDLQSEINKQIFINTIHMYGTSDGYISSKHFLNVINTSSFSWRLPNGITNRLKELYNNDNNTSDEIHDSTSSNQSDNNNNNNNNNNLSSSSSENIVTDSGDNNIIPSLVQRRRNSTSIGNQYFTYGDFLAFQEVLANLPFICNLIDRTVVLKKGRPISRDDFKIANQVIGLGDRISRRQIEIIFNIFDLNQDGYITTNDTVQVCGVQYVKRLIPIKGPGDRLTLAPITNTQSNIGSSNDHDGSLSSLEQIPFMQRISRQLYNFSIATIVGGISIGILYPVDLVKTRLMNQRIRKDTGGWTMYRNSLDCLQQAFRTEGFTGLYRGVTAPLLGVASERAIKLQVHDLLLQAFSILDDDVDNGAVVLEDRQQRPNLFLLREFVAGGCAGASQLLVTGPVEITKIRMQLQGETSRLVRTRGLTPPVTPNIVKVIQNLGFPGIYRGASACLLRDIPFSAFYFPSYCIMKDYFATTTATEGVPATAGSPNASALLAAGTLAAIPAAIVTSPADVVKTRLQAITRAGEMTYTGIRDCVIKMYENEGIVSFFQGSSMRVLRIAPQFGITMLTYESLVHYTGLQINGRPPTTVPVDHADYMAAFPPNRKRFFDL